MARGARVNEGWLLGDNAFFGVNHHSRAVGDAVARRFERPEAVVEVCLAARRQGAGGVMLSSHERAGAIVAAMRREPLLRDFPVYPNIPYIMKYVQSSTQNGIPGVAREVLASGSWVRQLLTVARGGIAYARRDFHGMLRTAVDLELAAYRGQPLGAVFLHNGLVDLALGQGWINVLTFWDRMIRERYGVRPGFGTLNLPVLARALREAGVHDPLIMAPFNLAGFHMNPGQAASEAAVNEGGFTLLAMNVLVSGAADPTEAFRYLGRFPNVRHAVLGTTNEQHMVENAALLDAHTHIPSGLARR